MANRNRRTIARGLIRNARGKVRRKAKGCHFRMGMTAIETALFEW